MDERAATLGIRRPDPSHPRRLDQRRDVTQAADGPGRHRPALRGVRTGRLGLTLRVDGIDQPESGPAQPAASARAGRGPHPHHGARRRRAPGLQHPGEGASVVWRVPPPRAPDGHGDLQRPHPHPLGREPDVLALAPAPLLHSLPPGRSTRLEPALVWPRSDGQRSQPRSTGGHPMRAIAGCALFVLALVGAPALATPASAQSTTATAADVQRLQDQVYNLDREISRLRTSDPQRVSQLQSELDDLRDEVVYLRVKLRREGTLSRTEYTDVRTRLDDLRGRVRDTAGNARDTTRDTNGQPS